MTSTHAATLTPVLDRVPAGFGDLCHQYAIVCGYYECVHGHVLRIGRARRGGLR